MASSILLRRSAAMNKLFRPILSPSSLRSLSNSATSQMRHYDEDERDMETDHRRSDSVTRRRDSSPNPFSGVFDPFSPPRSLNQILNLVDQVMENPFVSGVGGSRIGGLRKGWDVKEDNDALYLKIDMPGLGKEHVKVSVEQNTLVIKGEEGESEDGGSEEENARRRYSSRIDLPLEMFKTDEIKAEMKNGVLRVSVPKVKADERKDVRQVTVE